jgi:hypothetical protein
MIPKLLEACGTEGSILAYFGQFESERIKELADFAPDYKDALLKLVDRIVDPLPIIRDHVYDNAFAGSFSLKNVGPALLGESSSYEGMLVGNGTAAQRAFEEMISDSVTIERRQELARASLEYCKKDTLVMLELVRWMMSAK